MSHYSSRAQFPRKKSLSPSIRAFILERDANLCFYCEYEADCVDHIVPYSYGGTDKYDNLVACCSICNSISSNKMFDTLDEKRNHVRQRYGPYLEDRARRIRRKLSICADCKEIFEPAVEEASFVLCGPCYEKDSRKPPRLNKKGRLFGSGSYPGWKRDLS